MKKNRSAFLAGTASALSIFALVYNMMPMSQGVFRCDFVPVSPQCGRANKAAAEIIRIPPGAPVFHNFGAVKTIDAFYRKVVEL